jgi:hypothetical protein
VLLKLFDCTECCSRAAPKHLQLSATNQTTVSPPRRPKPTKPEKTNRQPNPATNRNLKPTCSCIRHPTGRAAVQHCWGRRRCSETQPAPTPRTPGRPPPPSRRRRPQTLPLGAHGCGRGGCGCGGGGGESPMVPPPLSPAAAGQTPAEPRWRSGRAAGGRRGRRGGGGGCPWSGSRAGGWTTWWWDEVGGVMPGVIR